MATLNCWEMVGCGRDGEGRNVDTLGTCPVTTETRLHGVNRGINGGRACWALPREPDPTCPSKPLPGLFRKGHCLRCPFLLRVEKEEGPAFSFVREAFDRLRQPVRAPRWS